MKKAIKFSLLSLLAVLISALFSSVFATNNNTDIADNFTLENKLDNSHVKIIGEKELEIKLSKDIKNTKNTFSSDPNASPVADTKKIKLLEVEIDDNLRAKLESRLEKLIQKKDSFQAVSSLSKVVDLGMNNVPVLDQGNYGTCATFSATAILDALFNVGDYISQQCLLEIGVYKYHFWQTFYPGWDGGFPDSILNRVKYYGVVNKQKCPHLYPDNGAWMMPFTYYSYSLKEPWVRKFNSKELTPGNVFEIKRALDRGNRVLISNLLYLNFAPGGLPVNGKNNGLWALPNTKNGILRMYNDLLWNLSPDIFGAHAIIVTGYDDANQRFKIRNSWGPNAGDDGEFYMEYDYYFLLNIGALEVYSVG